MLWMRTAGRALSWNLHSLKELNQCFQKGCYMLKSSWGPSGKLVNSLLLWNIGFSWLLMLWYVNLLKHRFCFSLFPPKLRQLDRDSASYHCFLESCLYLFGITTWVYCWKVILPKFFHDISFQISDYVFGFTSQIVCFYLAQNSG